MAINQDTRRAADVAVFNSMGATLNITFRDGRVFNGFVSRWGNSIQLTAHLVERGESGREVLNWSNVARIEILGKEPQTFDVDPEAVEDLGL